MRINKYTTVTDIERSIACCKAQMKCFAPGTVYHETAKERLRRIKNKFEYTGSNIPNERPEL
jgi:hypothetical protein